MYTSIKHCFVLRCMKKKKDLGFNFPWKDKNEEKEETVAI